MVGTQLKEVAVLALAQPVNRSAENYTKYDISFHQFYLSCSILIINCGIV